MEDGPETSRNELPRGSVWSRRADRRTVLKGAGLVGAAGMAGPLLAKTISASAAPSGSLPIRHVIVPARRTGRSITTTASHRSPGRTACRPGTRNPTGRAGP